METATDVPQADQQLVQLCAVSIAQSNAQLQGMREYVEEKRCELNRVAMEAQQLRSDVQQLRNLFYYVEREKNNELSRSALLQELVEAQRRIIRDYEQRGHPPPGTNPPPALIHYEPPIQENFSQSELMGHHENDRQQHDESDSQGPLTSAEDEGP
jgi:hypothetical protein